MLKKGMGLNTILGSGIPLTNQRLAFPDHGNHFQAIAEYLDTLSELLARLDSLQDFVQLCGDRRVKSSKELLPSNDVEPGLYFVEGY